MSKPVAGAFAPALFTVQLRSTTRVRLSFTEWRVQAAAVSGVSTTTNRPRPNASGTGGLPSIEVFDATDGLPEGDRWSTWDQSIPTERGPRPHPAGWSPNWPRSTPNSAS